MQATVSVENRICVLLSPTYILHSVVLHNVTHERLPSMRWYPPATTTYL